MPTALLAACAGLLLGAVADRVLTRLARRDRGAVPALDSHRSGFAGPLLLPVTAALGAGLVGAATGPRAEAVPAVYAVTLLVVLAVVDVHTRRMPNLLTVGSWPVAVALVAVAAALGADVRAEAILAAALVSVAALALALCWPAALGMGDAKVLVLLAVALVPLGPATLVRAAVAGLALSGLWSATLLLRRRRPTGRVAAGPLLALGAVAVVCLG